MYIHRAPGYLAPKPSLRRPTPNRPEAHAARSLHRDREAICRVVRVPQSTARLSGRWNVHGIDRSGGASSVYIHRAPGNPVLEPTLPSDPKRVRHPCRPFTGTRRPSARLVLFPKVLPVFPADGMYTELAPPGAVNSVYIHRSLGTPKPRCPPWKRPRRMRLTP